MLSASLLWRYGLRYRALGSVFAGPEFGTGATRLSLGWATRMLISPNDSALRSSYSVNQRFGSSFRLSYVNTNGEAASVPKNASYLGVEAQLFLLNVSARVGIFSPLRGLQAEYSRCGHRFGFVIPVQRSNEDS